MSAGRLLWLAWCALWALAWATVGWLIFPVNLLLFLLSLALMLPAVTGRRYP